MKTGHCSELEVLESTTYHPQLQAINAGKVSAPSPNAVHNTTFNVGDVIVQGQTSPITPRDIARSIQRELRRGTIPSKF